jgi:histidinol phosphatase-like enzyme
MMKSIITNANKVFARDGTVNGEKGYAIKGWIGYSREIRALKDDTEGLNRIVILTREGSSRRYLR